MTPEKELWQAVVYKALIDATAENPSSAEDRRAKWQADGWLRTGGRDFQTVCALAEIDPDYVRENYVAGRIDKELLRHTDRSAA